ncbi:MAG: preprotein translocase subunit SecY [Candidatus Bathyarchaeota archaeon]|nr:MAG: preprotein translocase subunit SecY [Candidatus Bathyarchaeota archaeon]
MAGRFLGMFRPLSRFMPEVKPPERRIGFNEKLFWTALALALYLVMSEVPLYGIGLGGEDPFRYLRVIFASRRGSLMELGIGPIVTAGLILQLLAGSGMVGCDFSDPTDRSLFTSASKVFSIIFIAFQASAYIIGGIFQVTDVRIAIIIFIQLLVAGVVLMLLDELIQKGWGIGSGISLFIMAGVAQNIMWASLAPTPPVGDGKSYGALIALSQTVLSGRSLGEVLLREGNLPSMLGFFATIVVFLIVIYFEGVRVELPIAHAGYRGFRGRYPIKLLYVSNLPVIFAAALFANVYFFSQILWNNYNQNNTNFWFNLLGQYKTVTEGGQSRIEPMGGLVYYVLSPQNLTDVMKDPSRAIIFTGIMVAFCIVFSITWLEVGGLGPSTVAKQLVDSGMQIPGFRRSQRPIELLLKRYIPVVAVLGGVVVGLIASVADFFGVFGSGMGVLLSVGILYQYYQLLMQERIAEMYPALRGLLGG